MTTKILRHVTKLVMDTPSGSIWHIYRAPSNKLQAATCLWRKEQLVLEHCSKHLAFSPSLNGNVLVTETWWTVLLHINALVDWYLDTDTNTPTEAVQWVCSSSGKGYTFLWKHRKYEFCARRCPFLWYAVQYIKQWGSSKVEFWKENFKNSYTPL